MPTITWGRIRFLTLLPQEICSYSLLLLILILHAYHILAVNLIRSRCLWLILLEGLEYRVLPINVNFFFNKDRISFQACQLSILLRLIYNLFYLLSCLSYTLNSLNYMVLLLIRRGHFHRLDRTILDLRRYRCFWLNLNRFRNNIRINTMLWLSYCQVNWLLLLILIWLDGSMLIWSVWIRKLLIFYTYWHEVLILIISHSCSIGCQRLSVFKILLSWNFLLVRIWWDRCMRIHIIHYRPTLSFLVIDLQSLLVLHNLFLQVFRHLLLNMRATILIILWRDWSILVLFVHLLKLIPVILFLDVSWPRLCRWHWLLVLLYLSLFNHLWEIELWLGIIRWRLAAVVISRYMRLIVDINLLLLELQVCLNNSLYCPHVRTTVNMECFHKLGHIVRVLPLLDSFEQTKINQSHCWGSADSWAAMHIHI